MLAMTADTMARDLLGLAEHTGSEANSALDRGDRGPAAKSTVEMAISANRYELVFDAIIAGPRDEPRPALRQTRHRRLPLRRVRHRHLRPLTRIVTEMLQLGAGPVVETLWRHNS